MTIAKKAVGRLDSAWIRYRLRHGDAVYTRVTARRVKRGGAIRTRSLNQRSAAEAARVRARLRAARLGTDSDLSASETTLEASQAIRARRA